MKHIWKIIVVFALMGLGMFYYFTKKESMDLPSGQQGAKADSLAKVMMTACRYSRWQETRYVLWTFADRNSYVWDRSEGNFILRTEDLETHYNIASQNGQVMREGIELFGEEKTTALHEAWANFCNDSFWLEAPFKVMDPGTKRYAVDTEDGLALLVQYESGGVTPGDAYLWYIGAEGYPYAYRMWTSNIPIDGMKATWRGWQELHTGALISTIHDIGPAELKISDLQSGSTLEELEQGN